MNRSSPTQRDIQQIANMIVTRLRVYEIYRPSYDAIFDMRAYNLDIFRNAIWSLLAQTDFSFNDIAEVWSVNPSKVAFGVTAWMTLLNGHLPEIVAMQNVLDLYATYIEEQETVR